VHAYSDPFLFILLIILVVISAFFSGSETAMTSINRYRLRHLSRKNHKGALRVEQLIQRPDRMLGVILLGNTFANILASAVATVLAVHLWGDVGVIIATVVLTLVILIFSETAPKTLALIYPERVAYPASLVLRALLFILYPFVWFVNAIANGFLRGCRVTIKSRGNDPLNSEELRSVVNEAKGKISSGYHEMLLRILDLEHETIEDAMIPRSDIYGVDVEQPWDRVVEQLLGCPHRYVPLFIENIDQALGMLSVRRALTALAAGTLNKQSLMKIADEIYFIPDTGKLSVQLHHFQQQQRYIGLVVDEYGDIQGIVSLKDIVEEIVGEFEQGAEQTQLQIREQADNSVVVDGGMYLRDLNRMTGWELPTDGPKTLSGLMMEHLEIMPQEKMGIRIAGYPMEIERLRSNTVDRVRVYPQLKA
jgi:Mg2+/Co2+ transporter CorB